MCMGNKRREDRREGDREREGEGGRTRKEWGW
jgi:hypothetical protein